MHYHITPGLGDSQGQGTADPEGSSGYQDGFSIERHIHQNLADLFLPDEGLTP
jgi:hypothetical protein